MAIGYTILEKMSKKKPRVTDILAGLRGRSYWLLAIGYWLLAIGYWLLAIGLKRIAKADLDASHLNARL
jgi:hypothetical protein